MLDDLASAAEIDKRVDRLLRDADAYGRFPTPVDDIVETAKLTLVDDYVLSDSKIAKAPAYLRTLLRSARQKVQGLVDRRERVVHISPEIQHEAKRRFVKLHETTHDLLPHQQDLVYADTNETLSLATKRLFEREANQGAAELLFQRSHFKRDAADLEIGTDAIWVLADRYGGSFHAALRRYAEGHDGAVAAIVFDPKPVSLSPKVWRREEAVLSKSWKDQFGSRPWPILMNAVSYPFVGALDLPIGDVAFPDRTGSPTTVRVQTATNGYKKFVLIWVPQRHRIFKARRAKAILD